ncbi:hypothetical protein RUESEDTHA_00453 [Ruegeria sp. THAF57]|uniref:DUF2484 family protein n=1 Tax=Ruegeria sp. THAF57 TaxID=2744555 RepID=UPI0015E05140|nr:DUF2484 family protein [Ruegeria sp. THAF57]CAD0183583.1 hypothetical protein RUESEDTHA_00453 [Ruegeria sp. THAF57]
MNVSLALAFVWGIAANVLAMIPSKDNHWTRAYVLIAVGIPILGYVTLQNGPWIGLVVLAAGMSVLRWPVIYLGRWVRKVLRATL